MRLLDVVFLLLLAVVTVECGGSYSSCAFHAKTKRSKYSEPLHRVRRALNCNATQKYRSYDGSCNNLNNPTWGAVDSQLQRVLDPVYDDSEGTPRTKYSDGTALPNARDISNAVHFENSFISKKFSTMLMQWGQFIDHDITGTAVVTDSNGDDIDCCPPSNTVETDPSSACFPITVPSGDGYYPDNRCINFVRSAAVSGTGTDSSNPRQQYNTLSAFIDGSHIYGVTEDEADDLRDKASGSGLMKTNGQNFLPDGDDDDCFVDNANPNTKCFKAGDARVNVWFGLQAMHTLFLREHNRIAGILKTNHPTWDDETLYQEARRIVAAELQVITYNEWLPLIIGDDGISTYNLAIGNYNYNVDNDPRLNNVFSTAAFRFGHSMVPENFTIDGVVYDTGVLFKRTKFVREDMHAVLESLISERMERADAWYVDGMRNKMFESDPVAKDGVDVVALNIQRGRDHGLPDYNSWRAHCNIPEITNFRTGHDFGGPQARDLEEVYNNRVDGIDLYSGGISEIPVIKASVGKLYICLIGEGFQKLRDGDRFHYESTDTTTGFTQAQRTELEKTTIAKVLCNNGGFSDIQKRAFRLPSSSTNAGNPSVGCSSLQYPDLDIF